MEQKEQWFNKKEVSAGKKRLLLTWWIYKIFGKYPVKIIAFFVTLITLSQNKELKRISKKYFQYLYEATNNKKYKPSNINSFKHCLSYSFALVDKMITFSNNYKNIYFKEPETETKIIEYINKKQGIFFITTHIGNMEILRAFITQNKFKNTKGNIFLQANQCEIFNEFVNKLSNQKDTISLIPVENIGLETAIDIKEKIENGEFIFMGGDRLSANTTNTNYQAKLLNHNIKLPLGVLKFALMLDCPVFFTTCIKENNGYYMYAKELILSGNKTDDLELLKREYPNFMEELTLKHPYQFYNFFDIFD